MNLLIDAHVFDGKYQGSRTYLTGIYRAIIELLAKQEENVIHLFFAAEKIDLLKGEFGSYSFVHFVVLPPGGRVKRLTIHYPKLLKQLQIDVAHFQYLVPLYGGCKYVNTIHDLLFIEYPQYFSLKYRITRRFPFFLSFKKSELVLTVSEFGRRQIVQYFGDVPFVHVVENGIGQKLLRFSPNCSKNEWLEQKELKPYILCVSRFEPRKNQAELLRVFVEKGINKNYDLLFIGARSEDYPEFDSLLANLSPEVLKAVHIWSHGIDDTNLYTTIKHAEVLVYPSNAEGFGLPPIEAYVLQTPVLCSNNTAMAGFDFLGDGLMDIGELPTKLVQFLTKPPIITKEAAGRVAERYNWNKQANSYLSLLLELKQRL